MTANHRSAGSMAALAIALALAFTDASTVRADVPRMIDYQGKLRDAGGVAVEGTLAMRFRLYDADTGGNTLFDESHASVAASNGLFSVLIGSAGGGVPDSALNAPAVYLGIAIGGGQELTPRTRLVSSPHAIKAHSAEQLVRPGTFNPAVSVNAASGDVGIGTTSPGAKLDVAGAVKITDGSQGAGKVLTSDASGLANWQTPSGGSHLTGSTGVGVSVSGTNTFSDDNGNVITISLSAPARVLLSFTGNMGFGSTVQSYSCSSSFNVDAGSAVIGNVSHTPFPPNNQGGSIPASGTVFTGVLSAGSHTFRMRINVGGGPYNCSISGTLYAVTLH